MSDSGQASSQEDEDLHLAKGRLMLRLSSCLVPINSLSVTTYSTRDK